MKKYLLFLLSFVAVSSFAAAPADKVVLKESTLNPGGDAVEVTASLSGVDNHTYCGFNIDIVIPEWMDVVKSLNDDEEEVYCIKTTDLLKSVHQLSSNVIYVEGKKTLRVTCISIPNKAFKATSGDLFAFKLKASIMAKPGTADISIVKTDFGEYNEDTKTATYYHFPDSDIENISISANATTSLNISADVKWNTCMLPFSMEVPEGVKAFSCLAIDEENCELQLTEVNSMEAYVPYIVYSENGHIETLTGVIDAQQYPSSDVVESGYLSGAMTNQKLTSGYVLQNLSSGVKFYSCGGEEVAIPAGMCWVNNAGSEASAYQLPSQIPTSIISASTKNDKAKYFTVSGAATDGSMKNRLYIRDGKKIIVK